MVLDYLVVATTAVHGLSSYFSSAHVVMAIAAYGLTIAAAVVLAVTVVVVAREILATADVAATNCYSLSKLRKLPLVSLGGVFYLGSFVFVVAIFFISVFFFSISLCLFCYLYFVISILYTFIMNIPDYPRID